MGAGHRLRSFPSGAVPQAQRHLRETTSMSGWKLWVLIAVAFGLSCLPLLSSNNYLLQVAFRITLFAALGLAWNLVGGYAGQLSLGHAAFCGTSAYGRAIITAHHLPMWISLILATLLSTMVGGSIGKIVLRLRSPFL